MRETKYSYCTGTIFPYSMPIFFGIWGSASGIWRLSQNLRRWLAGCSCSSEDFKGLGATGGLGRLKNRALCRCCSSRVSGLGPGVSMKNLQSSDYACPEP